MAHGDYTGKTKALLARKAAQEQQLAASQAGLVSEVVTNARKEVISLFVDSDLEAPKTTGYDEQTGQVMLVDLEDPNNQPTKFQATEDMDDITIGKDRHFSLEAGRTYKAPRWVVEHLDEKELVRH